MPLMATIWQQNLVIYKKELPEFILNLVALLAHILGWHQRYLCQKQMYDTLIYDCSILKFDLCKCRLFR